MPQGPITSSALDDPSGCQDARVVKGIACMLPHHFSTQMISILALACTTRSAKYGDYLVDPASSHMLVSKIKPCMSKYKLSIL
jgi:hypothetical protein